MKHQVVVAHPASQDRAGHEPSQSSLSRPSGDHPIAQGRKDFTIADVLAWARTKPADGRYEYLDPTNCAVAQFGRETGRPYLIGVSSLLLNYPALFDVAAGNDVSYALTFGAIVARCEAALTTETPKSDWLAIDAYMVAEQVEA